MPGLNKRPNRKSFNAAQVSVLKITSSSLHGSCLLQQMMFRKAVLFFLSVLLSSSGYAQGRDVILKFSPLAMADLLSFPAIQAGAEVRLSERLSWYNELGIKYSNGVINTTDSSFIPSNGFRLKSEVRYYFHREGKRHFSAPGYYFAANAFFVQDHYNTQVDYYTNTSVVTDAFGVEKRTFGMNLLAGRQFAFYKRFMLDVYCGFGFRFRNIKTIGESFNSITDTLVSPIDLTFPSAKASIDANPGNSILPNFTMGLRLCFKL